MLSSLSRLRQRSELRKIQRSLTRDLFCPKNIFFDSLIASLFCGAISLSFIQALYNYKRLSYSYIIKIRSFIKCFRSWERIFIIFVYRRSFLSLVLRTMSFYVSRICAVRFAAFGEPAVFTPSDFFAVMSVHALVVHLAVRHAPAKRCVLVYDVAIALDSLSVSRLVCCIHVISPCVSFNT